MEQAFQKKPSLMAELRGLFRQQDDKLSYYDFF